MLGDRDLPLMVDLYELAMAQAYWSEGMDGTAVFSLFFRELPAGRNFMLACGQQTVAQAIESLRFAPEHLERLAQLEMFEPAFLRWLGEFRFSGRLRALPEGTPVFPQEPLLEIEAPIAQAQLLESLVMNWVHLETVLASQAVRLVLAAGERPVMDFGMRRMHGLDAAYRGVRAYRLAGLAGTSQVLGGQDFGLPVRGTMAHSFVQASDSELGAFQAYERLYPGTVLLVDTYDTEAAVARLIDWLRRDERAQVSAIRLDSGDLAAQAHRCRAMLDEAGLHAVRILASGGLDEYRIAALAEAPIDGFGVGSALGAGGAAPVLDLAYKLTDYAGRPRIKTSPGKVSYPGAKQVYRHTGAHGRYTGDSLVARDEACEGQPLLVDTLLDGRMVDGALAPLERAAERSREAIQRLPEAQRSLSPAHSAYPVAVSERLERLRESLMGGAR